jgi:hypothetical protein
MKFSATIVCAAIALFSLSVEALPTRRGNAVVFDTCRQDSDCQQGCCAFITGKCAGPGIAQTNGDGGCGYSNPAPNCNVAAVLGLDACVAGAVNDDDLSNPQIQAAAEFTSQLDGITIPATPSPRDASGTHHKKKQSSSTPASTNDDTSTDDSQAPASSSPPGNAQLTVFEACTQDSDCQEGCCGFISGKCAGPAVAQTNGSGGCGFGTAAPNCNVAALLGLSDCIDGAVNGDLSNPTIVTAAQFVSNLDGIPFPR